MLDLSYLECPVNLGAIPDGVTILEPQDIFNQGIVCFEKDTKRLVYSGTKLVGAMMESWDMPYEDAVHWLYYNTIGTGLLGVEGYPIILEDLKDTTS